MYSDMTKNKFKDMKPVNSPHKIFTVNNLKLTQELPFSTKYFRKKHSAITRITILEQR